MPSTGRRSSKKRSRTWRAYSPSPLHPNVTARKKKKRSSAKRDLRVLFATMSPGKKIRVLSPRR